MTVLRNLTRLLVILRHMGGAYRGLRRYDPALGNTDAPDRFVRTLVSLGPVFIKLGQVLSTRPDLLPDAYIAKLAVLQEHAPEMDSDAVRACVEADLGATLDTLFAEFDPASVAAASLAQVHKARLPDGTAVAVKVQRPNLAKLFHRDLDALALGLRMASLVAPRRVRRMNLEGFLTEFRRYSLAEIDFANEARVIGRFRENFSSHPQVRIPQTHPAHSSGRVLTMEWVAGMRLREAVDRLPQDKIASLVDALVAMLLKMFVSDGLFHADLHPGNIVFHEDGTCTLLDFGMYGELSEAQRDHFVLYWMAVVQRQTRRAFHHFSVQTRALPDADEAAFYRRFEELAEEFYAAPLRETSLARTYLEMMRAGYQTGFVFPAELMLHAKALTTAEALLFVLAPEAKFDDLTRPFIGREFAARIGAGSLIKRASQVLPELLMLGALPPAEAIDRNWDWTATLAVARDVLGPSLQGDHGFGRGALMAMFDPFARPALGPDADAILAQAWRNYDVLERDLPLAENAGAIITTHLAALTLALFQSLTARGWSESKSHALIYKIGWAVYQRMGDVPLELARALTSDPVKQLRIATDMFRKFPFGPPGYAWRDVEAGADIVAFDCTRCPVAEYFRHHDSAALCTATWCALDFPLAEKWGGRLERPKTIAEGDNHCDFRWHADPQQHRGSSDS